MTTAIIKVAPPNTYTSEYPRLTHAIAMAGANDFRAAKVAFGVQVKEPGDKHSSIRANPEYWRLTYQREVNHVPQGRVFQYRGEAEHLSETLGKWKKGSDSRDVIATLTLGAGKSMAAALRDVMVNGDRYAFECTMGSALVRLFIARRGFIGTDARFEEWQEADKGFDDLYFGVRVTPNKGDIHVPGLRWPKDARGLPLSDVREKNPKSLAIGDWLRFDHTAVFETKKILERPPYQGQNAIWLGDGLFYAHDYGVRDLDGFLAGVHAIDEKLDIPSLQKDTTLTVQLESM